MTIAMARPNPASDPSTVRGLREIQTRQRAQRDEFLKRLRQRGETLEELARLSGLSIKQVARIVAEALPDDALLTPSEKSALCRTYSRHPEAVTWLREQRTDARHNGHTMPRLVTNADSYLEDAEDLPGDDSPDE